MDVFLDILYTVFRTFVEVPGLSVQDGASNYNGGVGYAVAAYLQTKGLVDQAKILVDFKEAMEWIAALFWLASIGLAIGSVAVMGSYRQAAYLIIGPPLFFYMITTTIDADGTKLMVGSDVVPGSIKDQNNMLTWIGAIDGQLSDGADGPQTTAGGKAKISFFFGIYDTVITELVQAVVKVMLNTENKDHLRFVARERIRSYLLQAVPDDGPFSRLIMKYHFGQCAEGIKAFQAEGGKHMSRRVAHRTHTDIDNTLKRVQNNQWTRPNITIQEESVRMYLIGMSQTTIDKAGTPFGKDAPVPFTDVNQTQIDVSCHEIWVWVRDSIIAHANTVLDPAHIQKISPDMGSRYNWQEAYDDVQEWLKAAPKGTGDGAETDPVKVLAAYIYKNAVNNPNHSALQTQVASRSTFNSKEFEAVFGDIEDAETHGGYFKMRYFASAVPYIQGMLLYLLTIAFPFFAIFLVVPGRATSFLTWCSLWAWVKSWDIGFAAVNVVRDLMWHLTSGWVNQFDRTIDLSDPGDIIAVGFNNAPLMTENLYWLVMSGLTVSVPVLTAHLFMGATELYDMAKKGIDEVPTTMGQFEAKGARRSKANDIERLQAERAHGASKIHMDASARNPNASTITGKRVLKQDASQGALHGLKPAFDSTASPNGSVDNAHGHHVGGAKTWGDFKLENSNSAWRDAMDRGAAGAEALSAKHKAINAKDPNSKLPTEIPHMARGYLPNRAKMDDQAREDYVGHLEYMRDLEKQLSPLRADKIDAEYAKEIAFVQNKENELTWDDFFNREQKALNWQEDRLAIVTGRRQFVRKHAAGRYAIGQLIHQRQKVALLGRGPVDGMDTKALPGQLGEFFSQAVQGDYSGLRKPGLGDAATQLNAPNTSQAQAGVQGFTAGGAQAEAQPDPDPGGDADGE